MAALGAACPSLGPRPRTHGPPGVAAAGARAGITRVPRVAAGPANLTRGGLANRDHGVVIIDAVGHYAAIPSCPSAPLTAARYSSAPTCSGSMMACTGYPMIRLTATAANPAGVNLLAFAPAAISAPSS
jgi:hypothetical protein